MNNLIKTNIDNKQVVLKDKSCNYSETNQSSLNNNNNIIDYNELFVNNKTLINNNCFKKIIVHIVILISNIKVLLWKNIQIAKNNKKTTIFHAIIPVLSCLIVHFIQVLFDVYSSQFVNLNPNLNVPVVDKCLFPRDCITISYSLTDYSDITLKEKNNIEKIKNIEKIMKYFSLFNNLDFNIDVKPTYNITIEEDLSYKTISNSNLLMENYLQNNQNKTKYGIVFCVGKLSIDYSNQTGINNYNLFNSSIMDFNYSLPNKISIPCEFANNKKIYSHNTDIKYSNISNKDESKDMIFYMINYNITNSPNEFLTSFKINTPFDYNLIQIKSSLDSAILKVYNEIHENKIKKYNIQEKDKLNVYQMIKAEYSGYPLSSNRFLEKFDASTYHGPYFLFMVSMASFVLLLLDIVKEKDLKLRKSLIIIGLSDFAYWSSWIITAVFYAFIVSLVTLISGYLFQFTFFTKTPFVIVFMLFFSFSITMQCLSILISTIVSNLKSAYTVSYGLIIIGLIVQALFNSPILMKLIHTNNMPYWVRIITNILEIYPPYNFSSIYILICEESCVHFDHLTLKWIEGSGFNYTSLFINKEGSLKTLGDFKLPSVFYSFTKLYLSAILFIIMSIYFDNTIESNKGVSNKNCYLINFIIKNIIINKIAKKLISLVFTLIKRIKYLISIIYYYLIIRLLLNKIFRLNTYKSRLNSNNYNFELISSNKINLNINNDNNLDFKDYKNDIHFSKEEKDVISKIKLINSKDSFNKFNLKHFLNSDYLSIIKSINDINNQFSIHEIGLISVIKMKVNSNDLFHKTLKNTTCNNVINIRNLTKHYNVNKKLSICCYIIHKFYCIFYYITCKRFNIISKYKEIYLNNKKNNINNSIVKAVNNVYFHLNKGELFSLLGHNGAGKSTLIKMLSKEINPTEGDIILDNNDLIKDKANNVKSNIGLCPQHDILFNELTPIQHIWMYCKLKNFNNKNKDYLIKIGKQHIYKDNFDFYSDILLSEVNLNCKKDVPCSKLSGGMKRRLSILLSTIGNSKVVFLDEPTTGLDPVNKRKIWKLINNLKKNKAVLLTTHSMDEAESLSDRIGIISHGVFKCIDNSLNLKAIYGGGYLLNFTLKHNLYEYHLRLNSSTYNNENSSNSNINNLNDIKNIADKKLKKIMPSLILISNLGCNLVYNLSFDCDSKELKWFTRILTKNFTKYSELIDLDLESYIEECGMELTSLEEIFLKIANTEKEL